MNITQARKVLGKLSENMSDEAVLFQIESATLLKDMFFKYYIEGMKHKKSYSFTEKQKI